MTMEATGVRIVLKPDVKRIKNGYGAAISELRIYAHGFSPEGARTNLEITATMFLMPFLRQGTLELEAELAGIHLKEVSAEGLTRTL